MKEILYLAWRYLAYNRGKTAVLVGSIMLIVFLPVALRVLVAQSAEELTARAEATPLLVGAKGSALELALNSLYFESDPPERTTYSEALRVADSGLAQAIPLYVRFRVREQPIVGTGIEYFRFRGLSFSAGRPMAVLGECVVGAAAARAPRRGSGRHGDLVAGKRLRSGRHLPAEDERRAACWNATYTPDDQAVFVDLKTAWVIQGLVHGHQDLSRPEAAPGVLSREDDRIVANASVVQFNEITPDNIDSFHFHGDRSGYPITAVIAVPRDEKSGVILMGRYEGADRSGADPAADHGDGRVAGNDPHRAELRRRRDADRRTRRAGHCRAGLPALAAHPAASEIETMVKIGGAPSRIAAVLVVEVLVVLAASVVLAGALTLLTSRFGSAAIRAILLT